MRKALLIGILLLTIIAVQAKVIKFDKTKSETAGNADWTIGTSPNWSGAYSDFGRALRDLGHTTSSITGSSITANSLTGTDVLIIPEPQDPFTSAEKQVILNFIQNGGGVFLIADHSGSDRNNNGWDSRRVYNESLGIGAAFGFTFDDNSLYADPTSRFENPRTSLTRGLSQVGMYAGCSITITGNATPRIWLRNTSEEGLVTTEYGNGRVAAYGDSSPWDDGTGASGDELYDGWNDYDNAALAINIVNWLAKTETTSTAPVISAVTINPATPNINQAITITASMTHSTGINLAFLYWKRDGGYLPIAMTSLGNNIYSGTIPAQSTSGTIQYYLQAISSSNESVALPTTAPTTGYQISIQSTPNDDDVATADYSLSYVNPIHRNGFPIAISTKQKQTIHIYDIKGRLVQRFDSVERSISWDGKDLANKPCAAGIYIVQGSKMPRATKITVLP